MTMTNTTNGATTTLDARSVEDAVRDHAWMHFTQMRDYQQRERRPLMLVRGEGSTVWDIDGNAYLDLLAGIYSVNAGYGRKRIAEAMAAQAAQMPFVNPFGYVSVPTAVLADRLAMLAPLRVAKRHAYFDHRDRQLDVGAVAKRLALSGAFRIPLGLFGSKRMIQRLGEERIGVK